MSKITAVEDIFNTAITLERKAEAFYAGLSYKFSNYPEVSEFWKDMMKDEGQHVRFLQKTLDSLSEEQRLMHVDGSVANYSVEEMQKYLSLCDLQSIKTLDDAYETAYKLESSEINSKVKSLLKEFIKSEQTIYFILSVLDKHVSKLERFEKSFGDVKFMRNLPAKAD